MYRRKNMNTPICELKNRLKTGMSLRNMKAIDLSLKTNIPKSAISQYLSGYAKPKQDRIYLLSKALNVNPVWLMGYNVPMENNEDNGNVLNTLELAEIVNKIRTDSDIQCLLNIYYNELSEENRKRIVDIAKGLSGR